MAISIDTQDLERYPGIIKRISIDQKSVVLQGFDGDEQYILSFSTSAYADVVDRTNIQDYYITNLKSGWCKSSGFVGTSFALSSTNNSIEVKIDSTTGGISDGYYRVILDHNNGIPIDAEIVAKDMENKIRAIASSLDTDDIGFKLAYLNATVEFIGGKFSIISGSVSSFYSGANKSSVAVRASAINDCSEMLGFNLPTNSETIDSINVKEAVVLTDLAASTVSGTMQVTIGQNIGASINDCIAITDGENVDYFQVTAITDNTIISFDASTVSNDYVANAAKVQILRMQDPDAGPMQWFTDIDSVIRHGIKTIMNQIDYSG